MCVWKVCVRVKYVRMFIGLPVSPDSPESGKPMNVYVRA